MFLLPPPELPLPELPPPELPLPELPPLPPLSSALLLLVPVVPFFSVVPVFSVVPLPVVPVVASVAIASFVAASPPVLLLLSSPHAPRPSAATTRINAVDVL